MTTIAEKARMALAARDMGDGRWLRLVLTLRLRFQCGPRDVEGRIVALAEL